MHPLLDQLTSLRQTAARFQNEAHAAAIKLQHRSLEFSYLHDHSLALEQENARLTIEIGVLRACPDEQTHPAVTQVQDLTLALRRASEKIALTEDALFARTAELTDARSELLRTTHTVDAAYELAARMRAREEAAKARERELEFKARASEEERRMVDLVIQEYADLVRNLEGRKSLNPSSTIADALKDAKSSLHDDLAAFSTQSDYLHATIAELNAQVSDLQMALDAERTAASHDRALLAQATTELEKLDLEDQTAAKMVARYMKFSQSSTNALQHQIATLKTRHASTVATLELQVSIAEAQLASERARTLRLQDALDELSQDLARESYGRRREVALRLALLSREETIAEYMRRWVRRASESYTRCYISTEYQDPVQDAFRRLVGDAESLLSTLDDDIVVSDTIRASGSLARIALSREAVDTLRSELQDEMHKRIQAVRNFYLQNGDVSPVEDPNGISQEHLSTLNELVHESSPADTPSPASVVGTPEDPSVSHEDSSPCASTSATLLVDEEPKDAGPDSPSINVRGSPTEELATLPSLPSEADLNAQDDAPVTSVLALDSSSPQLTVLLSQLDDTKHRYDALQRAFRDCSLALKDLGRTLATSSSPPSPKMTATLTERRRRLLETVLARINDYTEDARVELEIRIADEALTAQGYATVLSVHGVVGRGGGADSAHTVDSADTLGEAEMDDVEASARAFVDGTDEGVEKAMERFGKKLEEVEHDVAVVKRAVHGLGMMDGERIEEGDVWYGDGEGNRAHDGDDNDAREQEDKDAGSNWTTWTAGLLGATSTPARSPTPVQTFGAVMTTSPRLRRATSPQPLLALQEPDYGHAERDTLMELNLRIPMPSSLTVPASPSPIEHTYGPYGYPGLGLGRVTEGRTGVGARTMSAMYALGGLRSASSVGLGVGFGGSPLSSPSPSSAGAPGSARKAQGGMGSGVSLVSPSPLRSFDLGGDLDAQHDFGGVE